MAHRREFHPYGTFIPEGCRAMIIGTFPIGKFSDPERRGEMKAHELDFFFGGETNLLWRLIGDTFQVKLDTREKIVELLTKKKIGIGDVIISCVRKDGGGSDRDLLDIEWNTKLLEIIRDHHIKKLFFTGRYVEKSFRRLFPDTKGLELVTLISPSAQSARSVVKRSDYLSWRQKNPSKPIYDFILDDYKTAFRGR